MRLTDMASAAFPHSLENISTVLYLEQAVVACPGAGAVVESSVAGAGFVVGGDKP